MMASLSYGLIVLMIVLVACFKRSRREYPRSIYTVVPSFLPAAELLMEAEMSSTARISTGGGVKSSPSSAMMEILSMFS